MAKATVRVPCKDCGETIKKETEKYNRKEADNWEEWAKAQEWQCPKCWGKAKGEEERAKGLILNVGIYSPEPQMIVLEFGGDTHPSKEKIKELGYKWDENYMQGMMGVFGSSYNAWSKLASVADLPGEIKKAEEIGAKIENKITEADLIYAHQMLRIKAEEKKIEDEKREQLGKPPAKPEFIAGKWNGTIYKNNTVYVDGKRIELAADEAAELKQYNAAKEEYAARKKELGL